MKTLRPDLTLQPGNDFTFCLASSGEQQGWPWAASPQQHGLHPLIKYTHWNCMACQRHFRCQALKNLLLKYLKWWSLVTETSQLVQHSEMCSWCRAASPSVSHVSFPGCGTFLPSPQSYNRTKGATDPGSCYTCLLASASLEAAFLLSNLRSLVVLAGTFRLPPSLSIFCRRGET